MFSPKISCLCLTANRVSYLKRAVECFVNQTYQNTELIVLYRDQDHETESFLQSLSDVRIKPYIVPADQLRTLGELRNLSIERSTGEYFIQWDDDDWYHNDRIMLQITAALQFGKEGSALSNVLFFDSVSKQAYFSFDRPWENSLLCKKSTFEAGYKYPQLNQREDTSMMRHLVLANKLSRVNTYPVYIYIFHGNNTWNQEHFNSLFEASQKLSADSSKMIMEILDGRIPNETASAMLKSSDFVSELDYFMIWRNHFNKPQ